MITRPGQKTLLAPFALLVCLLATGCPQAPEPASPSAKRYLFCFWNVENLFDDQDHQRGKTDEAYDNWYATDPEMLRKKVHHLAAALVRLNGGRGPDILALAEVESPRAAELLKDELNRLLPDETLYYQHVLMKEVKVGRHLGPALISRLPVHADSTPPYDYWLRILEAHLQVDGQELTVVVSHWTSQLSDKAGQQRARYAEQIYEAFHAKFQTNPNLDWLMAGDCNDPPNAPSITQHLRATGDRLAFLQPPAGPVLLNLFAGKPAKSHGTYYHRGWQIYDSIFVAPGMLDADGWTCDADTVQTVNGLYRPDDRLRKPWRFGDANDPGDRGASDHFPVTVWLEITRR